MSLNVLSLLMSPTVAQIELDGKLVDETVSILEQEFERVMKPEVKTLVLDMKNLSLISSAGIGLIIKIEVRLHREKKNLAMIYMQPQVERVFEIVRLTPNLHTFVTKEQLDEYLLAVQQEVSEEQ